MTTRDLASRIREALAARTDAASREQSIEEFLADRVGAEDAAELLETLRAIEGNHREISAEPSGRQVWLGRRIEAARQKLPGTTAVVPAALVTTGDAPSATLAREVAEGLGGHLIAGLEAVHDGEVVGEPMPEAQRFFERELGHPEDVDTLATVSSAVLSEMRDGAPGKEPVRAAVVAAAVDLGANAAKAGYQVSTGRVSPTEASEWVLDRGAAAAGEMIRRAVPELAEQGGMLVGAWLGTLVGAVPVGAAVGRTLGRLAGQKIAEPLARGVEKVVRALPSFAKKVASEVKSVVKRALSVFGW